MHNLPYSTHAQGMCVWQHLFSSIKARQAVCCILFSGHVPASDLDEAGDAHSHCWWQYRHSLADSSSVAAWNERLQIFKLTLLCRRPWMWRSGRGFSSTGTWKLVLLPWGGGTRVKRTEGTGRKMNCCSWVHLRMKPFKVIFLTFLHAHRQRMLCINYVIIQTSKY